MADSVCGATKWTHNRCEKKHQTFNNNYFLNKPVVFKGLFYSSMTSFANQIAPEGSATTTTALAFTVTDGIGKSYMLFLPEVFSN